MTLGPSQHPRAARTIVIASAHEERRRDWVALSQDGDTRVLQCAGPLGSCPLIQRSATCPLLDQADLAIYDAGVIVPAFRARLHAAHPRLPVRFARNARTAGGFHRPLFIASIEPRPTAGKSTVP